MNERKTEPLYRKVGRKYVPVAARWYEEQDADQMAVGTFRLTYAYQDGGRMYTYDVTPATAPMVAAMMVARKAMEDEIREKARLCPVNYKEYTKEQLAIIEKFRKDMGDIHPLWWTASSAWEIADAAMRAVANYKP